jgi:tetratricopeptide (TPR) repeat protein
MSRSVACLGTVLFVLNAIPAAKAQDEKPWRVLVIQALNAAAVKDYPRAEQAFVKALREAENFGKLDSRLGTTLNALGLVYRAEKKYRDAENSYRRALVIMATVYGSSIDAANVNFNIANAMFDQGRQIEALPDVQEALRIYEKLLGPTALKTAAVLCMEGEAYRLMKRYGESEPPLRRCADAREIDNGVQSSELADALQSLSLTLIAEGKFGAAEPRLKLAERIREKSLGITSPLLAQTMEDHAGVLKELGRDKEARRLTLMAATIRRCESKGQ